MKKEERVAQLLRINREHSSAFSSADARLKRRLHRAQHPTEIGAFKCMDGRLHIPIATEMPLGIIQPWRNLGGKFDLGWPFFGKDVGAWVDYSVSRGRQCIILVTYHFSKGDPHRGCAGFQYDVDAARTFTKELKQQVEKVFGVRHDVVYPIQVGFETDEDALVLHGENGKVLDCAGVATTDEGQLSILLKGLYPDMQERMLVDFLPLVQGNIRHIAAIRKSSRPITEAVHREWILGLGRGFDWLHLPNQALIVGPFSPNLEVPIRTAASIIKDNIDSGRIPKDGFVLLTSAMYRDSAGTEPSLAREKAKFLSRFATDVIGTAYPELLPLMRPVIGVVDGDTRVLELITEPVVAKYT